MVTATNESALIAALRAGDRNAFAALVDEHTPAMLRVAAGYVPSHAIAEEVVQETWIALRCFPLRCLGHEPPLHGVPV